MKSFAIVSAAVAAEQMNDDSSTMMGGGDDNEIAEMDNLMGAGDTAWGMLKMMPGLEEMKAIQECAKMCPAATVCPADATAVCDAVACVAAKCEFDTRATTSVKYVDKVMCSSGAHSTTCLDQSPVLKHALSCNKGKGRNPAAPMRRLKEVGLMAESSMKAGMGGKPKMEKEGLEQMLAMLEMSLEAIKANPEDMHRSAIMDVVRGSFVGMAPRGFAADDDKVCAEDRRQLCADAGVSTHRNDAKCVAAEVAFLRAAAETPDVDQTGAMGGRKPDFGKMADTVQAFYDECAAGAGNVGGVAYNTLDMKTHEAQLRALRFDSAVRCTAEQPCEPCKTQLAAVKGAANEVDFLAAQCAAATCLTTNATQCKGLIDANVTDGSLANAKDIACLKDTADAEYCVVSQAKYMAAMKAAAEARKAAAAAADAGARRLAEGEQDATDKTSPPTTSEGKKPDFAAAPAFVRAGVCSHIPAPARDDNCAPLWVAHVHPKYMDGGMSHEDGMRMMDMNGGGPMGGMKMMDDMAPPMGGMKMMDDKTPMGGMKMNGGGPMGGMKMMGDMGHMAMGDMAPPMGGINMMGETDAMLLDAVKRGGLVNLGRIGELLEMVLGPGMGPLGGPPMGGPPMGGGPMGGGPPMGSTTGSTTVPMLSEGEESKGDMGAKAPMGDMGAKAPMGDMESKGDMGAKAPMVMKAPMPMKLAPLPALKTEHKNVLKSCEGDKYFTAKIDACEAVCPGAARFAGLVGGATAPSMDKPPRQCTVPDCMKAAENGGCADMFTIVSPMTKASFASCQASSVAGKTCGDLDAEAAVALGADLKRVRATAMTKIVAQLEAKIAELKAKIDALPAPEARRLAALLSGRLLSDDTSGANSTDGTRPTGPTRPMPEELDIAKFLSTLSPEEIALGCRRVRGSSRDAKCDVHGAQLDATLAWVPANARAAAAAAAAKSVDKAKEVINMALGMCRAGAFFVHPTTAEAACSAKCPALTTALTANVAEIALHSETVCIAGRECGMNLDSRECDSVVDAANDRCYDFGPVVFSHEKGKFVVMPGRGGRGESRPWFRGEGNADADGMSNMAGSMEGMGGVDAIIQMLGGKEALENMSVDELAALIESMGISKSAIDNFIQMLGGKEAVAKMSGEELLGLLQEKIPGLAATSDLKKGSADASQPYAVGAKLCDPANLKAALANVGRVGIECQDLAKPQHFKETGCWREAVLTMTETQRAAVLKECIDLPAEGEKCNVSDLYYSARRASKLESAGCTQVEPYIADVDCFADLFKMMGGERRKDGAKQNGEAKEDGTGDARRLADETVAAFTPSGLVDVYELCSGKVAQFAKPVDSGAGLAGMAAAVVAALFMRW